MRTIVFISSLMFVSVYIEANCLEPISEDSTSFLGIVGTAAILMDIVEFIHKVFFKK